MSLVRKTIAALGMVAVSVVVRCGDDDDDEEREDRRSMLPPGIHAQVQTSNDAMHMTDGLDGIRLRFRDEAR